METIVKQERKEHDAHDIMLGILSLFPKEGKWDELQFHESMSKINKNYEVLNKLEFSELAGNVYCEEIGKVFDLLELCGLLKRKEEITELDLEVIKINFEEEIKNTFDLEALNKISAISEELKEDLQLA